MVHFVRAGDSIWGLLAGRARCHAVRQGMGGQHGRRPDHDCWGCGWPLRWVTLPSWA